MLEALHPDVRIRYRRIGPSWILGRSFFMKVARELGFDVLHVSYLLEQMDRIGEVP